MAKTDKNVVLKMIAHRIKEKRKEIGMSQEKISKLTGLSRPAISNIESGRQNVNIKRLVDFADALECDIRELLPRIR